MIKENSRFKIEYYHYDLKILKLNKLLYAIRFFHNLKRYIFLSWKKNFTI